MSLRPQNVWQVGNSKPGSCTRGQFIHFISMTPSPANAISDSGMKADQSIAGDAPFAAPMQAGNPALHRNEALYGRLFELMPGSILLMDARGFVLDANPTFCRQIGYPRQQLLGIHVSRFSRDPVEAIERNISRLMAGELLEHQVTNVQQDGSLRTYDLRETAITLPDGTRGILALANDITARLRAEEQKFDLERQLLHADKLKSLGVLAGGIAHEYNNILATLIGNLDLAMMDLEPTSPVHASLREAATAARRASNLTQQMLAYSGRGRFSIAPVDLSELVSGMAVLLRASISKKASVRFVLAPELPRIEADAPQLQQVIMNLITNASEALGDRPGLITITTRQRDATNELLAQYHFGQPQPPATFIELEVRDSGCGMDETVRARLFDPFFSTKFTGRGLGMSVVLGVVRGHQGGIQVTSQPGKGTSVSVLLPAAAESVAPAATPPQNAPAPGATGASVDAVLVVEDEATLRLLMERALKRAGFSVLTAEDGETALSLYRQRASEIGCVIVDFTMPKMDGVATLQALRGIRPDVRAILTSGYDVENLDQNSADQGFAAFLRKPFAVEELLRLVSEHSPKI